MTDTRIIFEAAGGKVIVYVPTARRDHDETEAAWNARVIAKAERSAQREAAERMKLRIAR